MGTAMFRAFSEQVRARIKEGAQHKNDSWISPLKLLLCTISKFLTEIWRIRDLNMGFSFGFRRAREEQRQNRARVHPVQ